MLLWPYDSKIGLEGGITYALLSCVGRHGDLLYCWSIGDSNDAAVVPGGAVCKEEPEGYLEVVVGNTYSSWEVNCYYLFTHFVAQVVIRSTWLGWGRVCNNCSWGIYVCWYCYFLPSWSLVNNALGSILNPVGGTTWAIGVCGACTWGGLAEGWAKEGICWNNETE